MLVSAIHPYESAIGIHMSPPSWIFSLLSALSHPSRLSQTTGFELPMSYSRFPLAIYCTYGNAYVSLLLSNSSHPPLPPQSPQVWFLCLCLHSCPAYRFTIFLDSIYMCVNICLFFSFWLISLCIIVKRDTCTQCLLQHYLQWLGHGSNLDVHQQMNG